MEISLGIIVLASVIAGQFVVIWRLLDRLLIQAHIPTLGPVRTTPPEETPVPVETRRKMFSVKIPE